MSAPAAAAQFLRERYVFEMLDISENDAQQECRLRALVEMMTDRGENVELLNVKIAAGRSLHTPPSHRVGNAGGQDLLKQLEANRVELAAERLRREQAETKVQAMEHGAADDVASIGMNEIWSVCRSSPVDDGKTS